MNENLENVPFGLGIKNPYGQFFKGQSYLNYLVNENGVHLANVTFEAGCRNNWHIHHAKEGGGQILLATFGVGYYQEEGKPARLLLPGDIVVIPANVKHWHGASSRSPFAHLAIEVPGKETSNEWLEEVNDKQYALANEVKGKIGIKQTAGKDALGEFAPSFAHYNDDVLFGENWANVEALSLSRRSLLTVIILASQGITDSSLKYHIENAKKNGVTSLEMSEALTHMAFYAGWPKAWAAFRIAKDVYHE